MDNFGFKVIDTIGEINLYEDDIDCLKLETSSENANCYDLCLTFLETHRIYYWQFIIEESDKLKDISSEVIQQHKVIVSLWKVLCLPFDLRELFISSEKFWALGQSIYTDICPFIRNISRTNKSKEFTTLSDDFMDIDESDEFGVSEFEFPVEIPKQSLLPISQRTVCLKCDLFDGSFIICAEDYPKKLWSFELIHSSTTVGRSSIKLPTLPLSYDSGSHKATSYKGLTTRSSPIVLFIDETRLSLAHSSQTQNLVYMFLDRDPSSSSNCVCLMGHPEGGVFFCLCSKLKTDQSLKINTPLQELCNLNQPVIAMEFHEEIPGVGGTGFLFIVGAFGKLVILTVDKFWKDSTVITPSSFSMFLSTVYLQSSIRKHLLFKDDFLFISGDFKLSVLNLCTSKGPGDKRRNEMTFGQTTAIMNDVLDIIPLNKTAGLFLLLTKQGSLYISKYTERKSHAGKHASLPILMNEIMHQNAILHNLSTKSHLQTLFFKALSKFASFKYQGPQKMDIHCLVTELDESLSKFVVNIAMKGSEEMDYKFWRIAASLRSHFPVDSIIISKSAPFIHGQNLSFEVQTSLLCPSYRSPFPLYIEVGLILVWPDCCFDILKEQLPLYVCLQNFILNELYFLKRMLNFHHRQPEQSVLSKLLTDHRRPISHLFPTKDVNFGTGFPNHFYFFLMESTAKGIVNPDSGRDVDIADGVFQFLGSKTNLGNLTNTTSLMCQNRPLTLSATKVEDKICVSIRSQNFSLLAGLRMAVTELFLNKQISTSQDNQYISIPASLKEACEKLSEDLSAMFDRDVDSTEFSPELLLKYTELRSKVSSALPLF